MFPPYNPARLSHSLLNLVNAIEAQRGTLWKLHLEGFENYTQPFAFFTFTNSFFSFWSNKFGVNLWRCSIQTPHHLQLNNPAKKYEQIPRRSLYQFIRNLPKQDQTALNGGKKSAGNQRLPVAVRQLSSRLGAHPILPRNAPAQLRCPPAPHVMFTFRLRRRTRALPRTTRQIATSTTAGGP